MSDIKYQVEFSAVYSGTGAQQLSEELKQVKQQVNDTNVDPLKSLDESLKNTATSAAAAKDAIDPLQQKIKDFAAGGKFTAEDMAKMRNELAQMPQSMGGFKNAIESVLSPMAHGEFSVLKLKDALFALNSTSTLVSSLGFAGVIVGMGLLMKKAKDAAEPIANLILEMQGLYDESVDLTNALAKTEKATLTMQGQRESLEQFNEVMQQSAAESDKLVAAIGRVEQAQLRAEVARIERESAQRVAASGNDPNVIVTERATVERQKAELTASNEIAQANREIEKAKNDVSRYSAEQASLEKRLAVATEDRMRYETIIRDLAAELGIEYEKALRLAKDSNALKEAQKNAEASGNVGDTAALKSLPTAAERFTLADDLESDITKQLADINVQAQEAALNLTAAMAGMSTAQDKATVAMITAGQEIGKGADSLKTTIEALKSQLSAAKENLAVAQGSTGQAGTAQEQTAAFGNVQRIEQELQRAISEQERLNGVIASTASQYTEAVTLGAQSVAQEAERASATTKQATDSAAKGVKAGGEQISKAADEFTNATVQGAGAMTSGIGDMSTSVSSMARTFTAETTKLTGFIANELAKAKADASRALTAANQADNNARRALSQNEARD